MRRRPVCHDSPSTAAGRQCQSATPGASCSATGVSPHVCHGASRLGGEGVVLRLGANAPSLTTGRRDEKTRARPKRARILRTLSRPPTNPVVHRLGASPVQAEGAGMRRIRRRTSHGWAGARLRRRPDASRRAVQASMSAQRGERHAHAVGDLRRPTRCFVGSPQTTHGRGSVCSLAMSPLLPGWMSARFIGRRAGRGGRCGARGCVCPSGSP